MHGKNASPKYRNVCRTCYGWLRKHELVRPHLFPVSFQLYSAWLRARPLSAAITTAPVQWVARELRSAHSTENEFVYCLAHVAHAHTVLPCAGFPALSQGVTAQLAMKESPKVTRGTHVGRVWSLGRVPGHLRRTDRAHSLLH